MIPVAEIFGPTIQGEGPHVGMKTIFVRVCGCDFNCSWCDSKFAWKASKDTVRYTPEELAETIINKCRETNTKNVVLTGGNPCLYDFDEVVKQLHMNNITVDVETQGSKLPMWLIDTDLIVISPKAPSSGQVDVFESIKDFLKLTKFISNKIAIKIPIFNQEDFEFAKEYYEIIQEHRRYGVNIDLYLSVGNTNTSEEGDISSRVLNDYKSLIEMVNESEMERVFILPQVHTLVWGNRQGV